MDDKALGNPEPGSRDRSQEDTQPGDNKPSYKSWKKKYRKMRLQFDNCMQQSENLHQLEQKALRTAKRLAVENDRLMDMLLSINECPSVPAERRIDLNVNSVEEDTDDDDEPRQRPTKTLRDLVEDVPHESYDEYVERYPEVLEEISPKDPELYPTSFLAADDIDNYLAELDGRIGLKPKPMVPPAAQTAAGGSGSSANFALRNPTSVYNWLRKHAPKTFLQDLEKEKEKDKDHDHGDKGEGSGRRKSAKGKRQSAASRKEAAEGMEYEEDAGYDANSASIRGKRKRGDDDGGYRPKGGVSRPTKKRKSRDLGSIPPKSRKSAGFAD